MTYCIGGECPQHDRSQASEQSCGALCPDLRAIEGGRGREREGRERREREGRERRERRGREGRESK